MRRSVFWLLDQYTDNQEDTASIYSVALKHAQLADQLGYSSLWLAEHHFHKLGTAPNPAVLLSAIAQTTKNIRLGPGVCLLPLRDPILTAEDYALVDILSDGRLNMGVGTGSQLVEFEALGRDFDNRREAFDKNLKELRTNWATASSPEQSNGPLNIAPIQHPAPPIFVATLSEDGAHKAGIAGHSILTMVSPLAEDLSTTDLILKAHSKGLLDGGHPHDSAEAIVVVFAFVAPSSDIAQAVSVPAMTKFSQAVAGITPDDPLGMYVQMTNSGTGLFGTKEFVEGKIDQYREIGVQHIAFVSRFGGLDAGLAEQSLRALASTH
ncbi:LLM class flavin-dependent oxidoreductase [Parvibaculaceae bacterium PLY_AMNH_Bact1]|nr:LLM class flavin-dependent oxidoreductase [Parvibaculaceae bacterium PLY_AMNH_Bact1]